MGAAIYKSAMPLDAPRKWLIAMFLSVLAFQPLQGSAGMTPQEVKAFEGYKVKAEKGDTAAQLNLGECYLYAFGVPEDEVMALKWLRAASEKGNIDAQYFLGCYLSDKKGDKHDKLESVKWLCRAADQGHIRAQYRLGGFYFYGYCVDNKDFDVAVKWYRKAAEQGDSNAQDMLGECYQDGFGVEKDEVEAYAFFNLASIASNASSRASLGKLEKKLSRAEIADGQKRTKELKKEIEAKIAASKARK